MNKLWAVGDSWGSCEHEVLRRIRGSNVLLCCGCNEEFTMSRESREVDFGTPDEVLSGLDRIIEHNRAVAESSNPGNGLQKERLLDTTYGDEKILKANS